MITDPMGTDPFRTSPGGPLEPRLRAARPAQKPRPRRGGCAVAANGDGGRARLGARARAARACVCVCGGRRLVASLARC